MLCKLTPTLKSWAEGGGDVLCGASDPFILLPLERPSCMLLSSILSVLLSSSTRTEMSRSFLLSASHRADSKVWVTCRFSCPARRRKKNSFSSAHTNTAGRIPGGSPKCQTHLKLWLFTCSQWNDIQTNDIFYSSQFVRLILGGKKQCITGLEFLFNILQGIKYMAGYYSLNY